MAKKKIKTMKKKEASNVRLTWNNKDDRPAITALQAIAKEFDDDATEALRKTLVLAKDFAIQKAKEVKKILKAS